MNMLAAKSAQICAINVVWDMQPSWLFSQVSNFSVYAMYSSVIIDFYYEKVQ